MKTSNAKSYTPSELASLCGKHYNASVETLVRHGDALITLRVRPDQPFAPFEAGQYATLGLGNWEPFLVEGSLRAPPRVADSQRRLIRRPYSITTGLVDEAGQLVRAGDRRYLEFIVSLVRRSNGASVPALTPRLFALQVGSRLHLAPKAHGRYTLQGIADDANVVFAATGAGEAPHNAMLAELLHRGHRGQIVSLVCVRKRCDLAYADAHRQLEQAFSSYRYIGLTTREPENIDPADPHFVGKQYLQDYVASGQLEREVGLTLAPASTHVFLCGNPAMIGGIGQSDGPRPSNARPGMIELLLERGFRVDRPGQPGNIHFEKYW